MKVTFSQPKGPWATRIIESGGYPVGTIRRMAPAPGYMITANQAIFMNKPLKGSRRVRSNKRGVDNLDDARAAITEALSDNVYTYTENNHYKEGTE